MRNILRVHMDTCLQSGIAKSPFPNVQKILLSREQRAVTDAVGYGSALLALQSRDQIIHNLCRDFAAFARINITEQHQMTEQNAPVRTKAANQMRPIESLCLALKNVRDVGAIEPVAFHDVRFHPNHFLWRTKLHPQVEKLAIMRPLKP
jgi:hypothetical protein